MSKRIEMCRLAAFLLFILVTLACGRTTPTATPPRPTATAVPNTPTPSGPIPFGRIAFFYPVLIGVTGDTGIRVLAFDANGKSTFSETLVLAYQAAWSPDGQTLAVRVGDDEKGYDIAVMAGDGSGLKQLTFPESGKRHNMRDATWSPDGTTIYFCSGSSYSGRIMAIDRDGANQRVIYADEGYDPSISPDGNKIAFTCRGGQSFDICIVGSDGTNLARLTSTPGSEQHPVWSPDGRRIAYLADPGNIGGENLQLYIMSADGTDSRRITELDAKLSGLAWSPDGEFLAFNTWFGQMYLARSDGSDLRKLTVGDGPSWIR